MNVFRGDEPNLQHLSIAEMEAELRLEEAKEEAGRVLARYRDKPLYRRALVKAMAELELARQNNDGN